MGDRHLLAAEVITNKKRKEKTHSSRLLLTCCLFVFMAISFFVKALKKKALKINCW
jgi:hypothetical protein